MTFFAELGLLFESGDAFQMRAHVAHDQIAVLLDLGARGRDLAPGIVDVSEKIPEHVKTGALGENEVGMRRVAPWILPCCSAINRSLSVPICRSAKSLSGIEPLLSGEILDEKIGERTKGGDADGFSFEIFVAFDVRPHHERLNDARHGVRQNHHVGAREHRGHHRRRRDRRNQHAARNQRL